jgi:uncharacterized membrane protein
MKNLVDVNKFKISSLSLQVEYRTLLASKPSLLSSSATIIAQMLINIAIFISLLSTNTFLKHAVFWLFFVSLMMSLPFQPAE